MALLLAPLLGVSLLAGSRPSLPAAHLARAAAARHPGLAMDSSQAKTSQVEDLVANSKSLFLTVYPKGPKAAASNVASGFTVSLAMIPEAVAFAFVCGVSPLVGLWSAVVMGFFAAAFGGRGGIITGASGACAVVMAKLVAKHGEAYLSAGVLLAGIVQLLAGYLRLGKFIRLVPHPVMLGFVNGLAIVMTRAQLTHFRSPLTGAWLSGAPALSMGSLTLLTMALVKLVPRVTTALPPALLATGLTTLAAKAMAACGLPARTLIDIAGAETFAGGLKILPTLGLPALPGGLAGLGLILPFSITMAAVGLIESLLTLQLVDGMVDDGTRGSTRKECVGQARDLARSRPTSTDAPRSGLPPCLPFGLAGPGQPLLGPLLRHGRLRPHRPVAHQRRVRRHLPPLGRCHVALPRRGHPRRGASARAGASDATPARPARPRPAAKPPRTKPATPDRPVLPAVTGRPTSARSSGRCPSRRWWASCCSSASRPSRGRASAS